MPRKPRLHTVVPGALAHVVVRFVDGRFLVDDRDRLRYLVFLGEALAAVDWILVSYALMSSHVHLGLLTGDADFSKWAHPLHTRFAMWLSWRYRQDCEKTLGPVLGDRPSTFALPLERAAGTIAYHHRNPVAAGVVSSPEESSWTSHLAYLGRCPPRAGLDVSLGLRLSGFADTAEDRRSFHRWVCKSAPAGSLPFNPELPLRALLHRPSPAEIAAAAADFVGENALLFMGPRTKKATLARRIALYVGRRLGYSLSESTSALFVSVSGASRLLSRPHDAVLVKDAADGLFRRLERGQHRVKVNTPSLPST